MGTPNRGATRSRLGMEALEDRTVPSTSYAPDRIVVTFTDPTNDAANQALLTRPPLATTAERLGFGIYRVGLPAGAWLLYTVEKCFQIFQSFLLKVPFQYHLFLIFDTLLPTRMIAKQ